MLDAPYKEVLKSSYSDVDAQAWIVWLKRCTWSVAQQNVDDAIIWANRVSLDKDIVLRDAPGSGNTTGADGR